MTDNKTAQAQHELSTKQLTNYFYLLLARKQYTQVQLANKARAKGYNEASISESLDLLGKQNLLHDGLVAEGTTARYAGNKGSRFVRAKLTQAGIEDLDDYMQQAEETLSIQLQQQIKRKYSALPAIERRFKIMRFLTQRGFVQTERLYNSLGFNN